MIRTGRDLHGYPNSSFGRSTNIVGVPGGAHWHARIQADGEKVSTCIFGAVLFCRNLQDDSDQCDTLESDHEDAARLHSVCGPAAEDTEPARNDVWRCRHELRRSIGVAKRGDYCREEKRDAVDGRIDPKQVVRLRLIQLEDTYKNVMSIWNQILGSLTACMANLVPYSLARPFSSSFSRRAISTFSSGLRNFELSGSSWSKKKAPTAFLAELALLTANVGRPAYRRRR